MSWWICSTERTLTEDVPAPPERVREFYVDLNNIRLVHPLVVSVRSIGREDTADGHVQTYQVQDRIPLGPFMLRTLYVARLCVLDTGDVVTEARQFPRVRLHGVVSFDGIDGGTRIVEQIRIEAPRLLAGVTVREAVNAHRQMLSNIAHRFA